MKGFIIGNWIFLIIHTIFSIDPMPSPSCTAKTPLSMIPIAVQETQLHDLNSVFKGYNLDFNIEG